MKEGFRMQAESTTAFSSPAIRNGILVLDGYGLRVTVQRRHLLVSDGIGRARRSGRFSKATAGIERLVLLGHSGIVSLDAFRWLHDIGAGIIQIDRDGEVISAFGPPGVDDPRLRRMQALAMTSPTGVEIARYILREKLRGEASVLAQLPDTQRAIDAVNSSLDSIEKGGSLDALLVAESQAAAAYWATWTQLPVAFARQDLPRIPEHWHTFGQRGSPLTGSPRLAANPANAILNYLYALLEAETRIACLVIGLDPGLGILHADQKARDSMTLDLMETVRPDIDAFILEMLRTRVFRAADFSETPRGQCRVLPPLTHALAETVPLWAERVAPVVERVARMLANAPGSRIRRITTPLTQNNRSTGRTGIKRTKAYRGPSKPRLGTTCRICGQELGSESRLYCEACLPERRREQAALTIQAAGPARLAHLRAEGRDPAHGGRAARRRGASIARRNQEMADWDKKHDRPDPQLFSREILPLLRGIPLEQITEATGLSLRYCALIRRGLYVPHPRHWGALIELSDKKSKRGTRTTSR